MLIGAVISAGRNPDVHEQSDGMRILCIPLLNNIAQPKAPNAYLPFNTLKMIDVFVGLQSPACSAMRHNLSA